MPAPTPNYLAGCKTAATLASRGVKPSLRCASLGLGVFGLPRISYSALVPDKIKMSGTAEHVEQEQHGEDNGAGSANHHPGSQLALAGQVEHARYRWDRDPRHRPSLSTGARFAS